MHVMRVMHVVRAMHVVHVVHAVHAVRVVHVNHVMRATRRDIYFDRPLDAVLIARRRVPGLTRRGAAVGAASDGA